MLWRDLGGRTKEKHLELQNLDPTSSPHLEEILFGGKVDLDLLSSFPKFGQESSEGLGGIELSSCCNNGGEREKELLGKNGEEPLFIEGSKKEPLGAKKKQPATPALGRPAPGQAGRGSKQRSKQGRGAGQETALGRPERPGGRGAHRANRLGSPATDRPGARERPAGHPNGPAGEPATARPAARERPAAHQKRPA